MTTHDELAAQLADCEYRNELTTAQEEAAEANNLVVIFGRSDDTMAIEGAVSDEVGMPGSAQIDSMGLMPTWDDPHEERNKADALMFFERIDNDHFTVAVEMETDGYMFKFSTDAPDCSEFVVVQYGKPYCVGLVIDATKWMV